MNTIQKFIKDNKLSFDESGSGLNSTFTILSGFALYLNGDSNNFDQVLNDVQENSVYSLDSEQLKEFERVFNFAHQWNYYQFWGSEKARTEYIFTPLKEASA